MDVHCSTCGEPWDIYHLQNEAIFETGVSVEEAHNWRSLHGAERLSARYRDKFQLVGWQFGKCVINVIHCPCCPVNATADPERLKTKAALEELLGDDEDGLAATYEDYRL